MCECGIFFFLSSFSFFFLFRRISTHRHTAHAHAPTTRSRHKDMYGPNPHKPHTVFVKTQFQKAPATVHMTILYNLASVSTSSFFNPQFLFFYEFVLPVRKAMLQPPTGVASWLFTCTQQQRAVTVNTTITTA